jgi:cytochrome c biogenesis protein CcmG, thiol:disulfide interchange protein DsbE
MPVALGQRHLYLYKYIGDMMTLKNQRRSLMRASIFSAALLLAPFTPVAIALDLGSIAPEISLPGVKEPVSLNNFKGKVVYVDFWASWCGPCKQSFPFMNALQTKYKTQGLEIIAVNLDANSADASAFLTKVPANFSIALDPKGDTPKRYKLKAMPSSYLVGRDGKVLAVHQGFKAEDQSELEKRIAQALLIK